MKRLKEIFELMIVILRFLEELMRFLKGKRRWTEAGHGPFPNGRAHIKTWLP